MTILADSNPWPEQMLDVLNEQQSIVNELAALADRQSELIASNRTDALLSLLSERQRLIDSFAVSQRALSELSEAAGSHAGSMNNERRQSMRDLVEAISERLESVLRIDAEDQKRLESSKRNVQTELKTIGRAAKARQAYGGDAGGVNRFADQHG